jgi:hypothetical protein
MWFQISKSTSPADISVYPVAIPQHTHTAYPEISRVHSQWSVTSRSVYLVL